MAGDPDLIGARTPLRAASDWRAIAGLIQAGVLVALLLAVYWRPINYLYYKWSNDGNWSHGALVPLFSLYFLYDHREALRRASLRPSYLGLLLLVPALAAYFLSLWSFHVRFVEGASLILVICGIVLLMYGSPVLRVAWFPIFFLIFAVPLPDSLYVRLTLPLRMLASAVASALLSLWPGLTTQVAGVVIDYDYHGTLGSLNVEEACSGMRLMMAFVTLGVAMAYLGDRPHWQRAVMVLGCVPIAVFCNIVRVTATGFLEVWGYRDWGRGTAHVLLGLAMLPVALGLFATLGWLLGNLFIETDEESPAGQS